MLPFPFLHIHFIKKSELVFLGEAEHIWMHIDAAYAGSAFVCPEYRHYMKGIQVNVHFLMFLNISLHIKSL